MAEERSDIRAERKISDKGRNRDIISSVNFYSDSAVHCIFFAHSRNSV